MLRITVLSIFLCIGLLFFNNCSDVGFSQKTDATGTIGGQECMSADCEFIPPPPADCPDCELVQKDYSINERAPSRPDKLDVLLVIDNSGSMAADRKKLAEKLDGFVQQLNDSGINWQMCHYTTQTIYYERISDNPLRYRQVYYPKRALAWAGTGGQTVLNAAFNNTNKIFLDSMAAIRDGSLDDGSGTEKGIASTYEFILDNNNANCFRANAALTTIVLSDEDEESEGRQGENGIGFKSEPQNLLDLIDSSSMLSDNHFFTFHSIIIRPDDWICHAAQDDSANRVFARFGYVYAELSQMTGGIIGDICASSYASQLTEIKDRIDVSLDAITLKCDPVNGTLNIFVNGVATKGYNLVGNKVVFTPSINQGSLVTGSYKCYEYQ